MTIASKSERTRIFTEVNRVVVPLSKVIVKNAIDRWMETPNEPFDGFAPLEVIEFDDVDRMFSMIEPLESGQPG